MKRKAIVDRNGTIYRDKQESLDFIDECELGKRILHGIEIVKLLPLSAESDMYKTIWFNSQLLVYERARVFISEKMGGVWNYAEFKT